MLPIDELVRVARLLDADFHWVDADAAASRWGRDRAVFVRSSATHVFSTGDLVLRMALQGTPEGDAVARSAVSATWLHEAGAPVPAPVRSLHGLLVEEINGLVVTALPRVPGRTYDDDELDTEVSALWGRTLARLHCTGWVHGDPEPDNLLVDGRSALFVDLDEAGPGDVMVDIAFALRTWTPPGGVPDLGCGIPAAFMSGYGATRPVSDDELERLPGAAHRVAVATLDSYRPHISTPADPDWPDWARNLHSTMSTRYETLAAAVPPTPNPPDEHSRTRRTATDARDGPRPRDG